MISILLAIVSCKNKAILFAGSRGWGNYRHQADIWAIYQEIIKRGFQKEDIIISCYDDIADHPLNPFKGKIFHELDHKENVYGGKELLSYKDVVTADSFYKSMLNLDSTQEDNVFLYFDDHGGDGFLVAPNFEEGALLPDEIAENLIEMKERKLFKNCIFFIEACFAGSVAKPISDILKQNNVDHIAIITASDIHESSSSDLYDIWMEVSLSNEFSSNFIDKIKESPECSISELFDYLTKNKKSSTPIYYGDESIKNLKISDFIGTTIPEKVKRIKSKSYKTKIDPKTKIVYDSETKEQEIHIKKLDSIMIKMAEKIRKYVKIDPNSQFDDAYTSDYFDVLRYFFKKYGVVLSKDSTNFTKFLRKLSHLVPKDIIFNVIDEVLL